MIALSGIAKRFSSTQKEGGTQALRDLSFDVAAGEFVSLLGPSGCGKSTALRLAAGLLAPDAGSIAYPGGKPEIGFVFQDPTLMPWADALTNARLPLDLKKVARREANDRAARALARVGLAGFEHAYPRELSGGMKMRVSIARALAAQPKLLLLDEPFAALDEITRNELGDDLLKLWREEGLTVLFVTHSAAESSYLASRVLVMTPRPGRIAADIALPAGRDTRLSPPTIEAQRAISAALNSAGASARAGATLREVPA
jgi:NitT/TauT family transport system ATP-binding protein